MAGVEASADRKNYIAVVQIGSDAQRAVAFNHSRAIYGQAFAEIDLISGEASLDADATTQIGDVEAQATTLSGQANAQATVTESLYASNSVAAVAATESLLITKQAGYQVASTFASSDAQAKATAAETLSRTGAATQVATINAATTGTEAATRVHVISASATADAAGTAAQAAARASGTALNAAVRVSQIARESANTVSNLNDEGAIGAAESAAVASIRAAASAATAAGQVANVNEESAAQVRASAGTASAEARFTRLSTDAHNLTLTTNTAALAAENISTATGDAARSQYQALSRSAASVYETDQQYAGSVFSADKQLASDEYRASNSSLADRYAADRNLQVTKYESANDLTGRVSVANTRSAADGHGADQQYAAVVLHESSEDARLFTVLAYADAHFNEVWPLVTSSLAKLKLGAVSTPGFQVTLPRLSGRGVYTRSQVQVRSNRAYAAGDLSAASDAVKARNDAAGRGMSANTPYTAFAGVAAYARSLNDSTAQAAESRVQAATEDAARWLDWQVDRDDQFSRQQKAYLAAEANAVRRQVGIVGGVGRILGRIL